MIPLFLIVFAIQILEGTWSASLATEDRTSTGACGECHTAPPPTLNAACPLCHDGPGVPTIRERPSLASRPILPVTRSRNPAPPPGMAFIPPGPFLMGYDQRHPDEGPSHTVDLHGYYIDLYEVTNARYAEFIRATGHPPPPHWPGGRYPPEKADHPVVFVSWFDARAYCEWRGKRLPTEQEWEKAARGTDGRIYPWGNDFDIHKANTPQRWVALNQPGDTMPVGSFPDGRSPYGLYDMSGNVWEWTESWYLPYPGNTHVTENYGHQYKVARGGSWKNCSFYRCGISAPTFNRGFFIPQTRNNGFGFRCAQDAPAASQAP